MSDIEKFILMSKYAGERFDLIQAAGGNTSVKLDNGQMLIKSSGVLLSEVKNNKGYSIVIQNDISEIVLNDIILQENNKRQREFLTNNFVQNATIPKLNEKPSIETLLHSLLLKFTLHTHPLSAISLLIRKNWRELLMEIFENDDFIVVNYFTPGIDLAIALSQQIKIHGHIPQIIFLQNHGLIVTSDNHQDIKFKTEYVLEKIETFLEINNERYKFTNKISNLLNDVFNQNNITTLSEDDLVNSQIKENLNLFALKAPCPDILVYCGYKILFLKTGNEKVQVLEFRDNFKVFPSIILYKNYIYIYSKTKSKAREIEEVLKLHILVLSKNIKNINFLDEDELNYLLNWDAEKYRQNK